MAKFQPVMIAETESNWLEIFKQPIDERIGYVKDNDTVMYTQVASIVVGIPSDSETYLDSLYELVHTRNSIYLLSENIDKSIRTDRLQSIQKVLMILQKEHLSVNRFFAFLEGEQLIPIFEDPSLHLLYRKALLTMIRGFEQDHQNGLLDESFRRVITDCIKWGYNHLQPWLQQGFPVNTPSVIWYGNVSISESYFLNFTALIGLDVLAFFPEGENHLAKQCMTHTFKVIKYEQHMRMQPFPKEKPDRKSTVTYQASQEIDEILHHDESMLYKPWQFRSYHPVSITLKTTYDELFILLREKSYVRPHYQVKAPHIYIPAIFAKISGISANEKEYWSRYEEITESPVSYDIRSYPFAKSSKATPHYHYQSILGSNGELQYDLMVKQSFWPYGFLPEGMQLGLAAAIVRYIESGRLKKNNSEDDYQYRLFLLNQSLYIPKDLMQLFQQFDYAQEVPKIVLYMTEESGRLTREDAATLLLMNELGLDIILFNPSGQNNIEQFILETSFDTHLLDKMVFNQQIPEKSFVKKLINKLF